MSPARRRAGARDGGVAAGRAIIRWAWRLFRREWRQQALVLALLTVAVAATVVGTSAAYNLGPAPDTAVFGTADQNFDFEVLEPGELAANVAALRAQYGTVDVITRRFVPVPGSPETVELRSQDPRGAYGGVMLGLRAGRYPAGGDEVAVTDSVARMLGLRIDSRFTLGDGSRTVVGLVENPVNLRDEFALLPPGQAGSAAIARVLVAGTEPPPPLPAADKGGYNWGTTDLGRDEAQVAAAVTALAAAAVAMVLISLTAAAGFAVVARRRRRQLGMLAAIGATRRQLRLVMLANGAVTGVLAALAGAVLGLLGWVAAAPYLETVAQVRLDRFQVLPWWLILIATLLAVAAATAAAWWPSRTVARVPVTDALSGRPSRPRPVRRTAVPAGALVAAGVICLVLAGRANTALVAAGMVAMVLGVLAVSPLVIRVLAAVAGRFPVAVRLALRDMARHQTRSGAALAAISLTIGIAVTVIVAVTTTERAADSGNLSERQLLVTEDGGRIRELVTVRTPAQVEALGAQVERIAALLDDPAVIPLEMAVDPDERPKSGRDGTMRDAWVHAVEVGGGARTTDPGPLFVATPRLLGRYGIDPGTIGPEVDVLTVRTGEIGLRRGIEEEPVANVRRIDVPAFSSAPTSFITPEALRRRGWIPAFAGWLVESRRPLTSDQIAQALTIADGGGLQVLARDGANLEDLRSLRTGAMVVGMAVALAVLAMTVGLIRGEAADDLRTLTAAGATRRIRRTLTAATSGALALGGAALGSAGAYLALASGLGAWLGTDPGDGLGVLLPVPAPQLLLVTAGLPLAAAVAGWLLGGRRPPTLAGQVID